MPSGSMAGSTTQNLRDDVQAGVTVALVAIPQCMAFAAIAGLDPVVGLSAAIVMGFVGAMFSGTPQLNIGPAVTTSSMVLAVAVTVSPDHDPKAWSMIAAWLAILTGLFTLLGACVNVGQFVKFVSRSVLVGLTAGAAMLIAGSQLAPFLGIEQERAPMLAQVVWRTLTRLDQAHGAAILMSVGTMLGIALGGRLLGPRFPTPFVLIVLGGAACWWCGGASVDSGLAPIPPLPSGMPISMTTAYSGPIVTDLVAGAASIALVGIIQSLAIARVIARRHGVAIDARRETAAIGLANLATGVLAGLPGAASFSRSALNDMAGARTRLSGIVCAVAMVFAILAAAPLAAYITQPAIAGLLMVTAAAVVDWRELLDVIRTGGPDRLALITTIVAVWFIPIHWAILIGLTISIAYFLRRVSVLRMFEMAADEGDVFGEQSIDDRTGDTLITMLQVEGPLFFAHADDVESTLARVFAKQPRVVILRMRRTHQVDFSVVAAMNERIAPFVRSGGAFVICGLTPGMHRQLMASVLGQTLGRKRLIKTTHQVFGSAHRALRIARELVGGDAPTGRSVLRRREAVTDEAG